jgi:hypothetical protein
LPLIADNTPPVVTVSATGFLVDGATWWTTAAAPSLTGTASDLHAPITVRAYVLGAEVAATVAGPGGWSLTVPATALPGSGAAIAVRATDAVGNVSAVTAATSPFVKVDGSPPAVDGLARAFLDELLDAVAFSPAGPVHDHAPAGAVTLGASAPPSCPTIHKYAYLTAVSPVATERAPNPVALAFRAADTGIGVDPTASTFTVTAPGGQVFGPFPVVATPAVGAPGAFDHLAELRRDGPAAIAPIGLPGAVSEGVFTVTFTARDRLGLAASVARCFTYRPLGPPLKVVLAAREAVRSSTVATLRDDYRLDNTAPDARVAELVNGTARAGVLELWVENVTADPAYVTFAAPRPPVPTVSRTFRTHAHAIASRVVAGPTCDPLAGPLDPLCGGGYVPALPADAVRTDQLLTVGADGPPRVADGWVPYVGVFEVTTSGVTDAAALPCAGCDPDEYELGPGVRRALVLGLRGLPDLRPESPGPYVELSHRRRRAPDVSQRHRQLRRRRQRALHALGALRSPQRPELSRGHHLRAAPLSRERRADLVAVVGRRADHPRGALDLGRAPDRERGLALDRQPRRRPSTSPHVHLVHRGELTMKTLVTIAASALAGALVVVACSDDAPRPADADAGVCTCPPAEAPITASRLHRVDSGTVVVPILSRAEAAVACPAGELLLGGSCYIDVDESVRQVYLREAAITPEPASAPADGWYCNYGNASDLGTAMVRAQALCLRP